MKIISNKKIIVLFISFLFLFSNTVFAVWDGLPYDPGEVNNPECLPSQTNCDVLPAVVTELDPVFIASQAFSITGTNISNWNTAYGWGNHASAGYITSLAGAVLTSQASPQTIGVTGARLAKLWTTDIESTNMPTVGGASLSAIFAPVLGADDNYVTDAEKIVIGNTSGTNSGDNAINSNYANDYRAANFIAGTNYIAPGGALSTPSSGVATNLTGTASGLTAGSVTNATLTTALTVNTGSITLVGNVDNTSALTIGSGAVSVSGTNTGDNAVNSLYSGLATSKADVGQTFFIGTTSVAINRASAPLTLAGITLTTPDIGAAIGTSLDLGTTTLYGSRAITVDTGGVLNIATGSANGDDFTVNTNKFVVEGDTGNVGIGTSSPTKKFTIIDNNGTAGNSNFFVQNTNASGAGQFGIQNNGTGIIGIQASGSAYAGIPSLYNKGTVAVSGNLVALNFMTNGDLTSGGTAPINFIVGGYNINPTMTITAGNPGNVGIGTTSPGAKLDVSGNTTTTNTAQFGNFGIQSYSNTNGFVSQNFYFDGAQGRYRQTGEVALFQFGAPNNGDISFRTVPSGTAGAAISSYTEALVVKNSGNIGLSTISPTNILSFGNGADRKMWIENSASGTVGRALTVASGGTVAGGTNISGGNLILQAGLGTGTGTSNIYFQTGTTLTTGTTLQTVSNKMTILGNGNIGVGTTSPSYKLDVVGSTATSAIRSWIGFDVYPVPDPTAPTGVVGAGGSVDTGAHWYGVTYVTALGETHVTYTAAQITTTAGNNTVTLTIPTSTDSRVTARKIYRTKAGTDQFTEYLLTTINDNTTTSYVDTVADSTLSGASGLVYFKVNTTSNYFTNNGEKTMTLDYNGTFIGTSAGSSLTTGGRNVFVGQSAGTSATSTNDSVIVGNYAATGVLTGRNTTMIGSYSGSSMTSGANNIGMGAYSLYTETSGASNTAIGSYSGFAQSGQSNNIFYGYYSGKYETGSNKLIIDSLDRSNEATSRSSALIYGVTNATATSQILSLGGGGKVGINNIAPDYALHVGSTSVTDGTILLKLQDADSSCTYDANTGAPACTSDMTLKKNITDQSDNLSKVLSLRPVTYNWLTDEDGSNVKHGFIAQEVAEIMPELVTNGIWTDGTTKKFLQTAGMTPYIVGAIKEINLKIININDFEKENDWRDSFVAWFANAENHITRIFTGEVCLTEAGQETVCLNRAELQSLKELINQTSTTTTIINSTPQEEAVVEEGNDNPPLVAPTCSDGIQNQDETDIDTGGVCPPEVLDQSSQVTPPITPQTTPTEEQVTNQDETQL